MSFSYNLHGTFLESCDCSVVCPCWVNDEADEGHCTGLVAWSLDAGSKIGRVDVSDRVVVSVTAHGAYRRGGTSRTVIFVDDKATERQRNLLVDAFAGRMAGPLADLASVSGDVLLSEVAQISYVRDGDRWSVRVRLSLDGNAADVITASGTPKHFDGSPAPMMLSGTALSQEFGAGSNPITAQESERFAVNVAALPGGYIDVEGRSGMSGAFTYRYAGDRIDLEDGDLVGAAEDEAAAEEVLA